jgi:predicted Zn finger-like uncharacterized protein
VFTRCPGCHTVHPVNAALLAGGGGRYRCGKCQKVSNALEALFDEWPDAADRPAPAGDLPVLGLPVDLEAAARARLDPAAGESGESPATRRRDGRPYLRLVWIGGGITLVLVIAVQVAAFLGMPVLPSVDVPRLLERIGLREPPPTPPFRDLERIHLVSRELRSVPEQPGRLRLDATIVNRAARRQPYPDLEITLLDERGQPLLQKRFVPADYLAPGSPPDRGMAPEAYLPLSVEFEDPGRQAIGFELEFR